jgi:hypothetical protein
LSYLQKPATPRQSAINLQSAINNLQSIPNRPSQKPQFTRCRLLVGHDPLPFFDPVQHKDDAGVLGRQDGHLCADGFLAGPDLMHPALPVERFDRAAHVLMGQLPSSRAW